MGEREQFEIRSYRRVFDLERRVYRIDRIRLNPSGVPIRGVAYFLALVALVLALGRVPGVDTLTAWVPWYARDLALPALSASVLTATRVGGRQFHVAAHALARYARGPRRLASSRACARREAPGSRWRPPPLLMLPDGSSSELRRLRYVGPGAARVSVEHETAAGASAARALSFGRGGLVVRRPRRAGTGAREQVIVLERGARLTVR